VTPAELLAAASGLPRRAVVVRLAGGPPRVRMLHSVDPAGRTVTIIGEPCATRCDLVAELGPYLPPRLSPAPQRIAWTSCELAVEPDAWRVSAEWIDGARVLDALPGRDRTLFLVSGEGLTVDATTLTTVLERCEVPGERGGLVAPVGGPVEALQLVVDRARAQARVTIVSASTQAPLSLASTVALAVGGPVRLRYCDGSPLAMLEVGDAVRLDRPMPELLDDYLWVTPGAEASLVVAQLGRR
jgi:environmental stress-induced protein Ves